LIRSGPIDRGTFEIVARVRAAMSRPYANLAYDRTVAAITAISDDPISLSWTPWRPLLGAWSDPAIASVPGLYRIRPSGHENLAYIGQTGKGTMHLRSRLSMLEGVFGAEMPYRDPHTAAPALWALVQLGDTLEVSVAPVEGSTPWRLGLEALQVALHRQRHGRSPTASFGRMPVGFRISSGNNARLVAAGKRYRGGRSDERGACHELGIPPLGPLTGTPQDMSWCGVPWLPWRPLREALDGLGRAYGLYRLRGDDAATLLYIGQGVIAARLSAHLLKTRNRANQQGAIFKAQRRLEYSYAVSDTWSTLHRLELETDLIAGHVLSTRTVPPAQFIG